MILTDTQPNASRALRRESARGNPRESSLDIEFEVEMMMMIFIGTLFCNLHRDANGLYLRQTSVQPAL